MSKAKYGVGLLMVACVVAAPAGCRRDDSNGSSSTQPSSGVTFDDVKNKTKDAADAAGEFVSRKAEEYEKQMRERLATLDKDVEALKKKGEALTGEARERWEQERPKLEEKLREAQKQFEQLKSTSAEAWEDAKGRVDRAWAELQKAAEDAEKQVEE